jgi:hypothetical protein
MWEIYEVFYFLNITFKGLMTAYHCGGLFQSQASPCGILITERRNSAALKTFGGTYHFCDDPHSSITIPEVRVRQNICPHLGSTKRLFQFLVLFSLKR